MTTHRGRPFSRVAAHILLLAALLASLAGCASPFASAKPKASPTATSTLTAGTPIPPCAQSGSAGNPIVAENHCPGVDEWRADQPLGPTHAIEGYTVPASVNIGGTVQLYVSTTAASFAFRVYRLGWYQGHGARLVYVSPTYPGVRQPDPLYDQATRTVSASNWTDPTAFSIAPNWTSGVYIVKMTSSDGFIRYTPLIVRNDAAKAPILVQSALFTYQAYNTWGGHSLYAGMGSDGRMTASNRSYRVSFDRPYSDNGGLMDLALYEYNFVRWFERAGFDATYAADSDIHLRPQEPLNHQLLVIAGHDEYWSTAMRDNLVLARNKGVSLAFMTANNSYWHVRVEDSPLGTARQVTCYKDDVLDPYKNINYREVTSRFRDAPLFAPERGVIGQQYHGIAAETTSLTLAEGILPYLGASGLQPGASLPGLVGGEYDQVGDEGQQPDNVEILARSPVRCNPSPLCPADQNDIATATLYTGPNNAKVLSLGTFYWIRGLDDDQMIPLVPEHHVANPQFQALTENLLRYLIFKHAA